MPVYRKCTECGKKILEYTLCKCEEDKRRKSYKEYRGRRLKDKKEKVRQEFYVSKEWKWLRRDRTLHMFGMDLIEWSKGNVVSAYTYHHVVSIKDDWSLRLSKDNVIGLTQENHIKMHKLMEKSDRDKKNVEKYLLEIIRRFNEEYW